MGYSPRGRKESDTTERLHFNYEKDVNVYTVGLNQHRSGHFWLFEQSALKWRKKANCKAFKFLHSWKVKVKSLSHVQLFATPWTVAYQATPCLGLSRQENWNGLPFPSPGDLPDPGIEPWSPAL